MSRDPGYGGAHRRTAVFLGLASLVSGAGPVYDSYVPLFLKEVLERETLVGFAMGIDNWAILLLVPLFGVLSDSLRSSWGRRVPFVVGGLFAIALAFSALPFAREAGAAALFCAIFGYSVAVAATRAPMSALVVDLVPSIHRTRANGIASVMMCLGAMPLIAASRSLYAKDPRLPFLLVGALAFSVALVYAFRLREPARDASRGSESSASGPSAFRFFEELRGSDPSLRRFLLACVAFHMCFQSFSSWFTRAGAERYQVPIEDCSLGFMVVGMANLLTSVPAGAAGARFGRRRCVAIGLLGMALASAALAGITTLNVAFFALAAFGISWSLALVNLLPMALEHCGSRRAATYAGAFLFSMSAGGVLGPLICGATFDFAGDMSALFALMASFVGVAFLAMLGLRPGYGEASLAEQPVE